MKFTLTIFIAISFLLGGFGMVAISTMDHEGLHTCPIAQMYGGSCSAAGGLTLAMHHINGLLSLTEMVLVTPLVMLLVLLAVGVVTTMWIVFGGHLLLEYPAPKRAFHPLELPILQIPLRWAALHNKRNLISVF